MYLVSKGKMYAHVLIKDCEMRKTFEIASEKHTEKLIESIEGIIMVMKYQMGHMTL